jgi:hypothetical protein
MWFKNCLNRMNSYMWLLLITLVFKRDQQLLLLGCCFKDIIAINLIICLQRAQNLV